MNTQSPQDPPTSPTSKTKQHKFIWEQGLSALPLSPGVYWFIDENGTVLYVGKAKRLKNRVSSYARSAQLSSKIRQMVHTAVAFKYLVLESELEALLTEAELINTYQPDYNTLLKDDKSPLYVHITAEEFPRVLKIRKKELLTTRNLGTILGPYPSAYKTQEVLVIARRIFRWCNQKRQNLPTGPCFYRHIELCSGACEGAITATEYQENIARLILFLKGKKREVSMLLKEELQERIAAEEYERAAKIRDQLLLIAEVTTQAYRLKPELTTQALQQKTSEDGIIYLQKILTDYLGLPKQMPLTRIECYDVSNTQGTNPAVSMVVFIDGTADTDEYRIFNIRSLNTPNDFAMLREALTRRQNHPEWGQPQLVIVDGGRGQVNSALRVWKQSCPVIGIAKNPDRLVIPYFSREKNGVREPTHSAYSVISREKLHRSYHRIALEPTNPALKLVQQLRDEAHRFSQKQHKKTRLRALLQDE